MQLHTSGNKYVLFLLCGLSVSLCSCANPRMAPRFEKASTAPIQSGISSSKKSVSSAKEKVVIIRKVVEKPEDLTPDDRALLKLQVASLEIDVDNALRALDTTEKARQELDAKLQEQTDKANKLVEDNNRNVAKIKEQNEIIDQVNSYWGIGAFAYGAKRLVKHLFILAAVLFGVGILLFVANLFFPAIGAGIGIAFAFIRRLITRNNTS